MVRKSKANSGIKVESITLKKGDRVITTGKGKTKLWGDVVGKSLKDVATKCSFNGRVLHFLLKTRWMQMRLNYIHLTNDNRFRLMECRLSYH